MVDDYTRECMAIEVDKSLGGTRVTRVLDQIALQRRLPETIVLDNGPERLHESFNGKFRDECLNEHAATRSRSSKHNRTLATRLQQRASA